MPLHVRKLSQMNQVHIFPSVYLTCLISFFRLRLDFHTLSYLRISWLCVSLAKKSMDFIAGWACPGSLQKCFQMWLYAVMSRSFTNALFEFLRTLMDVGNANDLNLCLEYVDIVLT